MRAVGAKTCRPAAGGNSPARLATSCPMFAFGSGGESTAPSAPVFNPARSASTATIRLIPSSPPTPTSMKPRPSCTGGKSADTSTSSEYPGWPPGRRVVSSPIARTAIPSNCSCIAPAYSPRSESKARKPPPTTGPASIDSPTPDGALKPKSKSATPRLPPPCGKLSAPSMPTWSTRARTGPIDADRLAETSALTSPSRACSPICRLNSDTPATDRPTGTVASRPALPRSVRPLSLDHARPRSNSVRRPSDGSRLARNPSAFPGAITNAAADTSADTASDARAADSATSSPSRAPPTARCAPSGCPIT